jgi:hypothetical protein
MFGAFQTFGKLGAIGKAISAAWSPLSLWPTGTEPGMWIDPSNLTSQWQDSAGTTQVSTPGTVADSSNPVGLALDIRAGAPETLGPELVTNGDFSDGTTGWTGYGAILSADGGVLTVTSDGTGGSGVTDAYQAFSTVAGMWYQFSVNITAGTTTAIIQIGNTNGGNGELVQQVNVTGSLTVRYFAETSGTRYIQLRLYNGASGQTCSFSAVTNKTLRGNHMLQSTSAARPLESAYDGQTLGPGNTYDATGYPIYQHFDGVDDGMATASFAAGTLTSAMDCMIAVRRDSGANCAAGLYQELGIAFGQISGAAAVSNEASGSPTVWVDGVQLVGGTSVTQATMNDAVTVGDWHIVEWRGLNLSAWTHAGFGGFGFGYNFPGARGDIMLYPSTASTADKDAARQYLADKYGVTLA